MTNLLFRLFLSMLFISACNNKQSIDSRAEEVVVRFYQWYINEVYVRNASSYQVPSFKMLDTNSYAFNTEEFAKRLNTIEYFTESFKSRLINNLEACNKEMLKVTWEYEPEPQFNIDECNYLWFDNWVGGQGEDIDGFSIIASQQVGKAYKVQVEVQIKKKKFTQADVTVVKEDNSYKIEDIRLVWN